MRSLWRWIMRGFLGITFVIGCAAMAAWATLDAYGPVCFNKQTYREVAPPSAPLPEYQVIFSQVILEGGWLRIHRDTKPPGLYKGWRSSLEDQRYPASHVAFMDQSWVFETNYNPDMDWGDVLRFEGFNSFAGRAPLWLIGLVLLSPSLIWLIAGVLVPTQRRRQRLANNQCPQCGYSLTGSSSNTCPECGR